MYDQNKLESDYRATTEYFRELAGSRFKLLALVPSAAGVAVALADLGPPSPRLTVLGLFGFLVTMGVLFYDIRNTQFYDALQLRAKCLEAHLAFPRLTNRHFQRGGAFLDRPRRERKLFGLFTIWHDRGLAIVYCSSLAVWSYLSLAGLFGIPFDRHASTYAWLSICLPVVVWLIFFVQLQVYDNPTDIESCLPLDVQNLLQSAPESPSTAPNSGLNRTDTALSRGPAG